MKKTGRFVKQFMLACITVALVLASSISAFAYDGARLTTLQAGNWDSAKTRFKTVSKVELYTNGESAAIEKDGMDRTLTPDVMELAVRAENASGRGEYLVTSSNREIAGVARKSNTPGTDDYYKIVITAGKKNGKAVITLRDKNNFKKIAKVTVTVKTLADEIDFGSNVASGVMSVAKGGRLSLGASLNSDVSNKKLKYSVVSQQIQNGEGDYVDAGKTKIVTVDGKGNVTGKNVGMATIRVEAQDQKYVQQKKKATSGVCEEITVYVSEAEVKSAVLINPAKNSKGGYDKLNLKTNASDPMHAFQLAVEVYDGLNGAGNRLDDQLVTFSSSKPGVARVDENGLITAIGNGTAKISVTPADGSKLKKAVSVTVNVTTDMERIYVPKDDMTVLVGKSVKLGATVDKSVSNKKLTYSAPQCYDADGEEIVLDISNKNKKNTISVSKTGVIKGLKPGSATFTVQSRDGSVRREIHVTVINPVTGLTATVPTYKNGSLTQAKATTLYLKECEAEEAEFDSCQITATVSDKGGRTFDADEAPITFASSNSKVASVDQSGLITAVGKGKATITVKANDGSNKKATVSVTVLQKVESILVDNAVDDEMYVVKGSSVAIKASADSKASNRKLSCSFTPAEGYADKAKLSGWKLSVGNVESESDSGVFIGTLTITAKDATTAPRQNACSREVRVYVTGSESYIEEDMISIGADGADGLSLKKGTKYEELKSEIQIPANVTKRNLVWKSSASSVASVDKNGVITAKKPGEAVITVTAKDKAPGAEAAASSSIRVRVTESQAEYEKSLNEKIKLVVTSEDYTWVGMKPSFQEKTKTIRVDIVDATEDRQDAQAVRSELTEVFNAFLSVLDDTSYRSVQISDGSADVFVRREGLRIKLYRNNEVIGDCGTLNQAALALANALSEDTAQLADWIGRQFDVCLVKESRAQGYEDVEYEAEYAVKFDADAAVVDSLIDARTAEKLAASKIDAAATGIHGVSYDAESNTVTVDISDGGRTIGECSDSVRESAVSALKDIFREAAEVTVEAQGVPGLGEEEARETFVRRETTDIDAAINRLIDTLEQKISGKLTNLSGLTDVRILAKADYVFSESNYSMEYYVVFTRSMESIDARMDQAITEKAAELNGKNADLGSVSYDAAANKITVDIKKGDKEIKDLSGMGVTGLLETILKKEYAVGAKVISQGKETEFESLSEITAVKLLDSITGNDDVRLGDLVGRRVVVEVYYNTAKTKSILYTVDFTGVKASTGEVKTMTEEPETEESVSEEPGTEESEAEEPETEEPVSEEPVSEEPGTEESEAEVPGTEESEAEVPGTEEPEVEEPETEEPVSEEPGTEESEAEVPAETEETASAEPAER